MYNLIELTSPVEILFAHTYETPKYDLSFCAQPDYIEISYIEKGTVTVLRDERLFEKHEPGVLSTHFRKESERCFSAAPMHRHWAIGARVSYSYERVTDEQLHGWISDNSFEKNRYAVLPDSLYIKEDAEITGIMERLIRARFSLRPGRDAECSGLFMLLLSCLTDRCTGLCAQENGDGTAVYFRRAANYISMHIDDRIMVGEIADYIGISVGYLGKIFKACTGRTIIEYINLAKLSKVKELMQDRGLSLKAAGEQTGFYDEHYLSRLYKKHMGSSAREDKKYNLQNEDFGLL